GSEVPSRTLVEVFEPLTVFCRVDLASGIALLQDLPGCHGTRSRVMPVAVGLWSAATPTQEIDEHNSQQHSADDNQGPKNPHPPPTHHRTISVHHGRILSWGGVCSVEQSLTKALGLR